MSDENLEARARSWLATHTARDDYRHSLVALLRAVRDEAIEECAEKCDEQAFLLEHNGGGLYPGSLLRQAARRCRDLKGGG